MSDPNYTPDKIAFRARCYVNGVIETVENGERTGIRPANGEWAHRFVNLPLVKQAEAEGWARDLRAATIRNAEQCLYCKKPLPDAAELLPTDTDWIEAQRVRARRFADAKEWRDSVMAPGEQHQDYARRQRPGTRRGNTFKPVSAPAFHAMQEASQNRHLHADPKAELERIKRGDLTERSRRMQGDDE